jgi:DNA-binding LacI/PurR family transcriptional regulator
MGVRLSEVAERAGVTASIASRVLNNKSDVRVAEETRARILAVADELGYRPDPYAQVLQSGKSSTIILVSPQSFYLMNARRVTRLHGALHSIERPILAADLSAYGTPRAAADFLLFTRPTAVIWVSPDWSDEEFREVCAALHERDTYMLAVDYARPVPPDVACDAVTVDRAHGCHLAVEHLIERVGDRVALIGQDTGGRLEGYRRALAEHGIDEEIVVSQAGEPPAGGYVAAQTLLREHPDVQGIFCHSDLTALGVIKAVRDQGKRVPEDVAVVGFDNEPWTEFNDPPLTTVSHPIEQLCSLSMSVLRSRLEGNVEPWCRIVLHPGLVIRESTAGAP